MKVAVLGTGMVGRAVAVGLAHLGLDVTIGTRDPEGSLAGTAPEDLGTWSAMNSEIHVATYAEAARDAVVVVNALNGAVSVSGIRAANIADGTVLLDIANPLDHSGDRPALFVGNDDSLGEQIQRESPTLRVVKSLLTSLGHQDVIDVGDISTARGVEAMMLLWVRLMGPLGSPYFTWKVAR